MNLSCLENNLQSNFYNSGTATGTFFNFTGINLNLNNNPPKRYSYCETKLPINDGKEYKNFRPKLLNNILNKKSMDKSRNCSTEGNFITETSRDKLKVLIIVLKMNLYNSCLKSY
jgi:hypothetical protein